MNLPFLAWAGTPPYFDGNIDYNCPALLPLLNSYEDRETLEAWLATQAGPNKVRVWFLENLSIDIAQEIYKIEILTDIPTTTRQESDNLFYKYAGPGHNLMTFSEFKIYLKTAFPISKDEYLRLLKEFNEGITRNVKEGFTIDKFDEMHQTLKSIFRPEEIYQFSLSDLKEIALQLQEQYIGTFSWNSLLRDPANDRTLGPEPQWRFAQTLASFLNNLYMIHKQNVFVCIFRMIRLVRFLAPFRGPHLFVRC